MADQTVATFLRTRADDYESYAIAAQELADDLAAQLESQRDHVKNCRATAKKYCEAADHLDTLEK